MASIALRNIGCIDYLAYGNIFMRAMFRPNLKLDVFFSARKAVDPFVFSFFVRCD
jgi:hypothetical protein